MTSASIEVLMMPPAELSPNRRHHWRAMRRVAREAREQAMLAAQVALNTPGSGVDAFYGETASRYEVTLDITVAWNGRRRSMDTDNLVAACKPFRDGIADALWAGKDAHVRVGEVHQVRGAGTTTLTLRDA